MHRLQIEPLEPLGGFRFRVYLDGESLEGVRRLELFMGAEEFPVVRLELVLLDAEVSEIPTTVEVDTGNGLTRI